MCFLRLPAFGRSHGARLSQLSYATGSPIPLFLTFTSDDEQALDLLCANAAIRLVLLRERLIGSHATVEGAAGQSNNTFREVVGTACFWPAHDEGGGGSGGARGRRQLQGEIDIRKSVRPTFVFPRFSLRVRVLRARTPAWPLTAAHRPRSTT